MDFEKKYNHPHKPGELRQDPITEKWVAIATERAKRPDSFASEAKPKEPLPRYKADCPFCNLATYPQEPDVLRLPDDPTTWQVHIFENKYPAFVPKDDFKAWNEGPYRATDAIGYHELLATRYHNQDEGVAPLHLISLELEALVLRYRQLKGKMGINYIQIIKNHGKEAAVH